MKRRLQTPYYSGLARISFWLFTIFVLIFCGVSCLVLWYSKREEFLRPYNQTLDMLENAYEGKQKQLSQLILPLLDSDQLGAMGDFFDDANDVKLSDYDFTRKMLTQLKYVSRQDSDISMIYLYKERNHSFYSYSVASGSFKKASSSEAFCKDYLSSDDVRMLTGTQRIIIGNAKTPLEENLYAIGSRMLLLGTGNKKPGVIFCYNADAFRKVLQSRSLSEEARFYIIAANGNVIFDSDSQYENNSYVPLPDKDNILSDSAEITVGNSRCIKSIYMDSALGYSALYYIPEKCIWNQIIQTEALLLTGATLCIIVIALLLLSSEKSFSSRMSKLCEGMTKVGGNDLNYRLPMSRDRDEFSFITQRFNNMCDQLQKEIDKTFRSNLRRQKAEFYALQTSINPHFLYNSLEMFRQKLHERGDPQMKEMLLLLSRLFQYQTHGHNYVMLAEEMENLQIYLDFFTIWREDCFSCEINMPDELLPYGIPKYTFQPIFENFFLHGLRPGNMNQIILSAKKESDDILIEIQDNGAGISAEKLEEIQNLLRHETDTDNHLYLGLANVHERIRITFGKGYGLTIDSPGPDRGTTIGIRMRAESVENLRRREETSERANCAEDESDP